MANVVPISLEILACFLLSTSLLHRYCDMVNTNIVTVVGVFISWFFSFLVILLLPADLTSTAYRQCLIDNQPLIPPNSTIPSIINATSNISSVTEILPNKTLAAYTTINPLQINSTLSSSTNLNHTTQMINIITDSVPNSTNSCVMPWNYVSDKVLVKLWRFIYWTCQFLTWILMPMMQSYSMAGDFSTKDKLKSAIRSNFIYYSTFGAIFTILLIYVIFKDGLDFANLKVIAISASNTWGLFLLVVLLGYGLVELPRFLINRSKYAQSLNYQYFRVARVNAEKIEAEEKLDDVLEEIQQAFTSIGPNKNSPLEHYLNKIVDKCPPDWKRRSNAFRRQAAASNTNYDNERSKVNTHDIRSLTRLHRKVIKVVQYHKQVTCKWNNLIKEVIEWEDVAKNQQDLSDYASPDHMFKSTLPREKTLFNLIYNPRIEWYWKCLIRIWLFKIIGYSMAALSLAVVWSEIAFPISFFSPKLSIFAYFVDNFQVIQQYFYMEIFSVLSMGYLAVCAFYTVFHMKIYNVYYLAKNGQTDEYSLLFSGMLLCRLAAPLCLNYLCLVARDSHIKRHNFSLETSFTTIMGHLDLIPIVNNGLNVFLPLCISAICLAIYFNFGTHILHSLGFEQYIEDDEMTIDWVSNGRDLVKRETTKLLRVYESSGTAGNYHDLAGATFSSVSTSRQTAIPLPLPNPTIIDKAKPATSTKFAAQHSPSSSSSSSSGFSRSLLPKGNNRGLRSSSPSKPATGTDTTVSQSNRLDDHIIDIRLTNDSSSDGPKRPAGFFDDI